MRIETLTPVAGKNTVVVCAAGTEYEIAQHVAEELELEVGRPLVAGELEHIAAAAQKRAAAAHALRYLRGRPRTEREVSRGRPSGRTQEIQRLIGRSLRAVTDLEGLGERTLWVDCDVLQADGGTRTAAICGGYLALHDALSRRVEQDLIASHPVVEACAAISVGIVDGEPRLDLPYVEDANAETDMNVVMTESGGFVEVQGTAEGVAFSRAELDHLLALAEKGIREIIEMQRALVADAPAPRPGGEVPPIAEADRLLASYTGPRGYDPRPVLAESLVPMLWIFGEVDKDIPTNASIAELRRMISEGNENHTLHIIPDCDHHFRNPKTGDGFLIDPVIGAWLREQSIIR